MPSCLAASIIVHGAYTRNVFYGGKAALVESFVDEFPGVTLEHFQHLTSIVGHSCFSACPRDMLKAALRGCCCFWVKQF